MKLPRDLSGKDLTKALRRLGYRPTRQTGSHIRLTINQDSEQHHITIPAHDPIKIGTLAAILDDVSSHLDISREELLKKLSF